MARSEAFPQVPTAWRSAKCRAEAQTGVSEILALPLEQVLLFANLRSSSVKWVRCLLDSSEWNKEALD